MGKKITSTFIIIVVVTAIILRWSYYYVNDIVYNNYINDESDKIIAFKLLDDGDSNSLRYIPEYILDQCFKYKCDSITLYQEGDNIIYKLINITRNISNIHNNEITVYNYSVLSSILLTGVDLKVYHKALYVKNLMYHISSDELDHAIHKIIHIIMGLLLFALIVIDYFIFVLIMKNIVFSSKITKFELESDLNKNITDVLHHELLAPYSVISNELDRLTAMLDSREDLKPRHDEIRTSLNNCKLACDSIYNIINLFNKSKRLKYNSKYKASIAELIQDSFENVKLYNINPNVQLNLENKSMLNSYTVLDEFGCGGFCNIFTVLFNNSVEAYANTLTIKTGILKDKIHKKSDATLKIIVMDDGIGIRVNPPSRIFKYGVSTKIITTSKNNLWIRVGEFCKRVFFYISFIRLSELKYSPRGIGLAVVKKFIESYGGEISVMNNEDQPGASFVFTIPIVETKVG